MRSPICHTVASLGTAFRLPLFCPHRAPLLWLVLPFMGGLAAGGAVQRGGILLLAALLVAAFTAASVAIGSALRSPRLWGAAVAAAMLLSGDASYVLHRHRSADWDGWPPREAGFSLRVERVFPQSNARRSTGLAVIVRTERHLRELAGQRIYFSIRLRPLQDSPEPSAVLSAAGLLSVVPRRPSAGTFDDALAGYGLNFKLTRGWLLSGEQAPNACHRFFDRLAGRMKALLDGGLDRSPGLAGIYRAMMLGQKADIPAGDRQLFLHSGTMHLFAINGVHIGIVAAALHALLILLRCPRLPGGALVLAALWIDVEATGASPSAMRAFIMVAAVETAHALRRPINPLSALATSALIVLLLDPMDFFSASFRMSYGVVTAMVTIGVPLAARLGERFPPFPDLPRVTWSRFRRARAWLRQHLLQGLGFGAAAALTSAITGVQFFGLFVPGGLIANLVFMPPAMLVIVAGLGSVFAGLARAAAIGRLFNHAAVVLLWLITALMRPGTRVPGMWFAAHFRADWVGPAALAALLAACLAGYGFGWRRERGGWWPPFAIVVLALIFGAKFGFNPGASGPIPSSMKSAYELAMERLAKSDPGGGGKLSPDKKARLAEIDRLYKGKVAEREIFLRQQLETALAAQNADDFEKIKRQIVDEKARLEEERESEKEKIRKS